MTGLTSPPLVAHATFLYSEPDWDMRLEGADIAFLGIPFGSGYSFAEQAPDQANAPAAMRAATGRILHAPERYDFDLGGPLYAGLPVRAVDCGDVRAEVGAPRSHVDRAEAAVRRIREAGALPVVLGGDHAIPIPVLRAFEGDSVTLIQIDQHIDWRDEVAGVRDGLSSPMRRASEMAHVGQIFQIGLRATGSARQEEVDAARAYGAHLITAFELHEAGMEAILARIPDGGRYYVTIDMDGLDPACAPAVGSLCPGGVTFLQARALLRGLVRKGRVVGMDIVEITPRTDVNQLTCITAGRLIVNLLGAAARAGHFGGRATT
jgi:agmatinase